MAENSVDSSDPLPSQQSQPPSQAANLSVTLPLASEHRIGNLANIEQGVQVKDQRWIGEASASHSRSAVFQGKGY